MKFRIGNFSSRSRRGNKAAGGGCLIVFGLFFVGIGTAVFVFLAKTALEEAATYRWTETLCTIRSSEIEDDVSEENPFKLKVEYSYELGGQTYTSTQYSLHENRHDNYEKLALRRKALFSDGVVCYVDPENPASAVIHRQGVLSSLAALFPLIFVVVGALIVWGGIAAMRKEKKVKSGGYVDSISSGAKGRAVSGWKIGVAFGSVFFLVGAGLSYPLAIRPISKMMQSEHWIETPCRVIWSTVRRHESTDSDGHTSITYSVDIFYEYEFNGEVHRSNNYGFIGGSSSGRSGKQKIVNKYRKGTEQICHVNPDLPEQAVLEPGLGWSALLGLIPLVFGGVGAIVLMASIRSGRKKRRDGPDRGREPIHQPRETRGLAPSRAPSSAPVEFDASPRILRPGGSRLVKTLVILGVALFWNGIVSVFVYQVVQGFRRGDPEWFLTIFMIPFVLVGLALLLGFFYQLLALANPRPALTLNPGTFRLGEPFEIRWELQGSASRLSSLKLSVVGVESATYRRGTSTHTSSEVFYADEFASISHLLEMRTGGATVTIPGDLMYSFDTGNNEIKYELRVAGDVPFWPDIGDDYEIAVLPPASNS